MPYCYRYHKHTMRSYDSIQPKKTEKNNDNTINILPISKGPAASPEISSRKLTRTSPDFAIVFRTSGKHLPPRPVVLIVSRDWIVPRMEFQYWDYYQDLRCSNKQVLIGYKVAQQKFKCQRSNVHWIRDTDLNS